MNTETFTRGCVVGLLLLTLTALGCEQEAAPPRKTQAPPRTKPAAAEKGAAAAHPAQAAGTRLVPMGKNVTLEIQADRRRVLVSAYVCRRTDQLEQFLCRKQTKEHEAVLAADLDARHIHAALLAAGAEQGAPVQFRPEYKPATGTTIKVYVRYGDGGGEQVTVPAQKWIRHVETKKDLPYDWVFAGSKLYPPFEEGMQPHCAANDGDVICISNFDTALLDLPIQLSNVNDALLYEAHTERIPELDTPVTVILEPVLKK